MTNQVIYDIAEILINRYDEINKMDALKFAKGVNDAWTIRQILDAYEMAYEGRNIPFHIEEPEAEPVHISNRFPAKFNRELLPEGAAEQMRFDELPVGAVINYDNCVTADDSYYVILGVRLTVWGRYVDVMNLETMERTEYTAHTQVNDGPHARWRVVGWPAHFRYQQTPAR